MYTLKLEFKELPLSGNKLLAKQRYGRQDYFREWHTRVALMVLGRQPSAPLTKCLITIIRHHYRMLDFDGCVTSMKPVVDGLVKSAIIKDDSYIITGPWLVLQKYREKRFGPLLEIMVQSRE